MVVIKKPSGDLRICIDPSNLNEAIRRPHYPLPTIEQILPALTKAKVFSLFDAKDGFWQIELTEESSFLTCFNTPFGRYRWTRMPFGLKCAPEEFQRRMHEELDGLEGVHVVADDILLCGEGNTMEEAIIDHERKLKALLDRCKEINLKINEKKMKLRKNEITYIGHLLSDKGVKPDPKKIETITNMPAPQNTTHLKRFLGMVNYLAKFLPNLS